MSRTTAEEREAATYSCNMSIEAGVKYTGKDAYWILNLLADYADLEKQVEELQRANEWQPIEAVPKDGTRILVYDIDFGVAVSRVQQGWPSGEFVFNESYLVPTHWKPLPAPPKAEEVE